MIEWIKQILCSHDFVKEMSCIWCTKCGKIKLLPCKHQWKELNAYSMKLNGKIVGYRVNYNCELCGKSKQIETSEY